MNKIPTKEEMEIKRQAKLDRAAKVAEIGETLTEEQVCELVSEKELVQKLPLFPGSRDEGKLRSLASHIRRSMAAEKVLDEREANNPS